ncbi:hypothetical protein EGO58_01750 [Limosilactobacillus reuteri]|uniref:hypothetical protein n=1 Tax=Limosilactobacillus reuteri TaxID=1598 RepID=UPI000F4D5207|nr:hypothetical protein [Limosilactobacillus reuteri]MDZ5437911.1 hypothetical protein [Limosilactobacillus reuteri]ROV63963.1 hypothetical protein EGO58_01750 [Limosilactobacillus reuteri]
MKTYSYPQHVKEDIKEFIEKRLDSGTFGMLVQGDEDTIQDVQDLMFDQDEITGNGSGSYTFNTFKAEQNLTGNWDLLREAKDELDPNTDLIEKGPEYCDVLIRCYLLDWCFRKALDDIVKEK